MRIVQHYLDIHRRLQRLQPRSVEFKQLNAEAAAIELRFPPELRPLFIEIRTRRTEDATEQVEYLVGLHKLDEVVEGAKE